MNPFVNPNQRSVSLSDGCKDLMDVLRPQDNLVQRFLLLILLEAQQGRAVEVVIGVSPTNGDTPVRRIYKIGEIYRNDSCGFPSHLRSEVLAELARLANLPAGQFPSEGVLDTNFGTVRICWLVRMTGADEECKLMPLSGCDEIIV